MSAPEPPATHPTPPRRLDGCREASRALQARVPVLRRASTAHITARTREFVLAGWSVADIAFAMDRKPDGTPWPHDGAHGVGSIGGWLRYRLAAWRDHAGTVTPSPAQRDQARHDLEMARQVDRRDTYPRGPRGTAADGIRRGGRRARTDPGHAARAADLRMTTGAGHRQTTNRRCRAGLARPRYSGREHHLAAANRSCGRCPARAKIRSIGLSYEHSLSLVPPARAC